MDIDHVEAITMPVGANKMIIQLWVNMIVWLTGWSKSFWDAQVDSREHSPLQRLTQWGDCRPSNIVIAQRRFTARILVCTKGNKI